MTSLPILANDDDVCHYLDEIHKDCTGHYFGEPEAPSPEPNVIVLGRPWNMSCREKYNIESLGAWRNHMIACLENHEYQKIAKPSSVQSASSGTSGKSSSSFNLSPHQGISWSYNGQSDGLRFVARALHTYVTELHHSQFSPAAINQNQETAITYRTTAFEKSIKTKIQEYSAVHAAFKSDLAKLNRNHETLEKLIDNHFQTLERSHEQVIQALKAKEKKLKEISVLPNVTGTVEPPLSSQFLKIKTHATSQTQALKQMFEAKNYLEVVEKIASLQQEVSFLRSFSSLPVPLEYLKTLKEAEVATYVDAQGFITFVQNPLLNTARALEFSSDPFSNIGHKIRYETNRASVALEKDKTQAPTLFSALGFLKGADEALSEKDIISARANIKTAGTLVDLALGIIPVVSVANDLSNILHGIVTGYDLFGNPMSNADYALRGFSAVLGAVGAGAVFHLIAAPFTKTIIEGATLVRKYKLGNVIWNSSKDLFTKLEVVKGLQLFSESQSKRSGVIRLGSDVLEKMSPDEFSASIKSAAKAVDAMKSEKGLEMYRLVDVSDDIKVQRLKEVFKEKTLLNKNFVNAGTDKFTNHRFGHSVSASLSSECAIQESFLRAMPDWINLESHALIKATAKSSNFSNIIVAPSAAKLGDVAIHFRTNSEVTFETIEMIQAHPNILKRLGF